MSHLVAIAAALALIVIVPGPNVFVVTTSALRSRRRGVAAALGVSTGDMVWAVAALVGVSALLTTARPVFEAVRWAGTAYLLWFSVQLWRSSRRRSTDEDTAHVRRQRLDDRPFVNGFVIDLSNPKAAVFFSTFYASLLPDRVALIDGLGVLAVTATVVYGWYLVLALALSHRAPQAAYQRAERLINRVAAAVVALFGMRLALQSPEV